MTNKGYSFLLNCFYEYITKSKYNSRSYRFVFAEHYKICHQLGIWLWDIKIVFSDYHSN